MRNKTFLLLAVAAFLYGCHTLRAQDDYRLQLVKPAPRSAGTFRFGTAANPAGTTITVDNKGFLIGGEAVMPVMGEIHYARVPERDWKRELLKMRAGGVTVAATYVFWIHHEEEENVWNWSGNRNLRKFIETCGEVGMPVVIRVGPFCHGEVYQGGFPDWIVDKAMADPDRYKLRSLAPGFMAAVENLYRNIFEQVRGLLWKDGGPVIGMQLENECRGPWAYYQALKKLALEIGYDLPFYTRTGWPKLNGREVFGEILPLYGDYADGFWERKAEDMPGAYPDAFAFKRTRLSANIATETFGSNQSTAMERSELAYPYFTCELGGGMQTAYHRRIRIFDRDALALCVTKVGSGSNLPGYYMYHGGTNPESTRAGGALHSMGEMQDSRTTAHNDVCYKSYDFQAPLGEMGQTNVSYHNTRVFHQMLQDWGGLMRDMDPVFPATHCEDGRKDDHLRWSVRTDGRGGFLFVNNYLRMMPLSSKPDVQFELVTTEGATVRFPSSPVTIPTDACFVWPFGIVFEGVKVDWASAQLFAKVAGDVPQLWLVACDGILAEICIDGRIYTPELDRPFTVFGAAGGKVQVCILSPDKATTAYKVGGAAGAEGKTSRKEAVVFSRGGIVYEDAGTLFEETWSVGRRLKARSVQPCKGLRTVRMGNAKVATMPVEADFGQAAVWDLSDWAGKVKDMSPERLDALFLKIDYKGDVARVYADGRLVADDYWNGREMLVRVAELAGKRVELKILPLGRDYPVYLQPDQRKTFAAEAGADGVLLSLDGIRLVERVTKKIRR